MLQLRLESHHQLLEGLVNSLGQHVLGLEAEGRNVTVRLEKVEQLGGVGHPEAEAGGVVGAGAVLDQGEDHVADPVQHVRQSDRPLLRHKLRSVVGGGSEPRGHVNGVGGGQFEVHQPRVEAKGQGVEELSLRFLPKLQHRGQDGVLASLLRLTASCQTDIVCRG